MEYAIELLDLTKKFGDKLVLNQIKLNIGKGEIFGLLGPSGAGKTTMIHIITGQLRQTEGEAMILGFSSKSLTGPAYQQIGMMLENMGLYERLSCMDNLKIIAKIHGIPKVRINEVLTAVGLIEDRNKTVMALSKGMKQRLLFARAILTNPAILFLDEPTSGLDPTTAAHIHSMILKQRENGATIFLTTHNMEEAAKLCDNIALLHEGSIIEYGEPKEICNRYNHQNKLKIVLTNGSIHVLENNQTSAELVKDFLLHEMITSIHSTEPDLGSVFIELTGRGLE